MAGLREDDNACVSRDDVEVRAVLKVSGEPDQDVVVQMPEWAAPVKKEGSKK